MHKVSMIHRHRLNVRFSMGAQVGWLPKITTPSKHVVLSHSGFRNALCFLQLLQHG